MNNNRQQNNRQNGQRNWQARKALVPIFGHIKFVAVDTKNAIKGHLFGQAICNGFEKPIAIHTSKLVRIQAMPGQKTPRFSDARIDLAQQRLVKGDNVVLLADEDGGYCVKWGLMKDWVSAEMQIEQRPTFRVIRENQSNTGVTTSTEVVFEGTAIEMSTVSRRDFRTDSTRDIFAVRYHTGPVVALHTFKKLNPATGVWEVCEDPRLFQDSNGPVYRVMEDKNGKCMQIAVGTPMSLAFLSPRGAKNDSFAVLTGPTHYRWFETLKREETSNKKGLVLVSEGAEGGFVKAQAHLLAKLTKPGWAECSDPRPHSGQAGQFQKQTVLATPSAKAPTRSPKNGAKAAKKVNAVVGVATSAPAKTSPATKKQEFSKTVHSFAAL